EHFTPFTPESAGVAEEDVTGKLLGDGRSALRPVTTVEPDFQRARYAYRINTQMALKSPVFHCNHCVDHDLGNIFIVQPLAIAWPHGNNFAPVDIEHADHLPVGGGFQVFIAG